MPWSLSPSHHGIELLLDEEGTVAQVEYDPRSSAWVASACPFRFPFERNLPNLFGGQVEIKFSRRGDLLKFFGLPLPGTEAESVATGRRAA